MKPDLDTIRSVSNLGGEKQVMTLDENALNHLMSVMTDLYSDPISAVIREYSTNAYDATVDAGSSEPIKVILPDAMNPNFIVQDFGIGMTTDQVLHVYSQYGNSTKRDSDEVVGMLGLGCKSGLTYASAFIIRTVRNGIETVANVAKNSENVGEIQIIDTRKTDARNGTTITIPVQRGDAVAFTNRANNFYQFWQPGTVLVNGKAPAFFLNNHDEWVKVQGREDTYYSKSANYGAAGTLVMGNVAYPLNSGEWSNPLSDNHLSHSVIHFAPIGAVNFAPSREELSYRGKTKAYLNGPLTDILNEEVKNVVKAEMDKVTNKREAFATARELEKLIFVNGPITWNGETVPSIQQALGLGGGVNYLDDDDYAWNTRTNWNGNNNRIDKAPHLSYHPSYKYRYIANAPANLSAAHKYGLREEFGTDVIIYFWRNSDLLTNEWVEVLDWKVLKGNLPKPATIAVKSSGKAVDRTGRNFAVLDRYGDFIRDKYVSDLADDALIFAFQPSNKPDKYSFGRIVANGFHPVSVYKADFDEFVNDNGERVVTSFTQMEKVIQSRLNALTDEDVTFYVLNYYHTGLALALPKSLDTDLAKMVELSVTKEELLAIMGSVDSRYSWDRRTKVQKHADKIVSRYPLAANQNDEAAVLEYINSLYTTRKGN